MANYKIMAMIGPLALWASPVGAHEPADGSNRSFALPASARPAAAVVDGFHAALRQGDTKTAAMFLAEDAIIFEEGGAERSKAEYASHHLPADAVFSQAVPSVVTRRTGASAGSMAWIVTEGSVAGSYKGKAVNRVTTETMILRQAENAWKIVHVHWSSAAKL